MRAYHSKAKLFQFSSVSHCSSSKIGFGSRVGKKHGRMTVKLLSEIWGNRPTVYWLYILVGGIYLSEEFSEGVKCSYFAIHIGLLFSYVMWVIGYFLTVELPIPLESVNIFAFPFVSIALLTFFPLLILHLRHKIIKILDFIRSMRKDVRVENSFKLTFVKRINIFEHGYHLSLLWYSVVMLCSIVPLVGILFNYMKVSDFSDLKYHLMPVPYIDHIDTLGSFCAAYFLELLLFTISATFALTKMSLVTTMAGELNNIVVDFCGRIQCTSLEYETEFGLHCSSPRLSAQFDRDMALLIREHREICK